MKTKEEVEKLKHNWCIDPCWDIEYTEGFEDHKEELIEYSKKMNEHWDELVRKREEKEMKDMGISDKSIYHQIKKLHFIIDGLEKRIEKLEDR